MLTFWKACRYVETEGLSDLDSPFTPTWGISSVHCRVSRLCHTLSVIFRCSLPRSFTLSFCSPLLPYMLEVASIKSSYAAILLCPHEDRNPWSGKSKVIGHRRHFPICSERHVLSPYLNLKTGASVFREFISLPINQWASVVNVIQWLPSFDRFPPHCHSFCLTLSLLNTTVL